VCTPKGFLFSREAILENLLEQKKANKRKLAAWETQQADDARKQVRWLVAVAVWWWCGVRAVRVWAEGRSLRGNVRARVSSKISIPFVCK